MALALYRKYRPATFAEVVGQEHVTEPLRTALSAGRINHAYLFSGPRGCGKTSSARIMARSLNCAKGPTPDPCGECNSCKALAPEGPGSVDVTELDAASHGGVDDARELRDKAFYAPAESRYRVFIIDEAHMVTTQGFNALLKIVEEPPEHVIFIFATTEPDKVLTTIRSRTHHYPFRLIPPSSMRELLERNVAAEGVQVEPAVYPLVIRAGGGSARDTQSVLDQLLAGAGPEGVTYSRAVSLLGVTDVALIDDMVDALSTEDAATVFGTVEKLAEAGHDPRRFATDLLDRLRDLVLLRAVPDSAGGLVSAPEEELSRMVAQAERIGLATLSRYADIVHNGLLEMRGATSPRLVLELLCARMLLPSVTEAEKALLARIERLERRATLAAGGGAPAEGGVEPPVRAAPEREFSRPSQRAASAGPAPVVPAPPAEPTPARPAAAAASPAAPAAPSGAGGRGTPGGGTSAATGAQSGDGGWSTPRTPGGGNPAAAGASAAESGDGGWGTPRTPGGGAPAASTGAPAAESGDGGWGTPRTPGGGNPAAAGASAAVAGDGGWGTPRTPGGGAPAGSTGAPAAESGDGGAGMPRTPAAAPETPAASGGMDAAAIRNVWPQLMTALRKFTGGRSLEAMLTQATVASVDGNAVTLTHKSEPLARRLSDQDNARKIAGALSDVLGGDWQVRCVHGNAPVAPAARPQQAAAPAPERSFTRQSAAPAAEPPRPAPTPPARPKVTTTEPDIPLPPEPADEDDDDLYNEDASPAPPPPPPPPDQDPDEVARKLLSEHLGARPLD
ncbi:DNA polymerase III subunit gamma and tau [Amycolatopsis australiensis]|uniref:DNA polymerase III subunit gamma/tau n=1 Tax=Amycolatopsis australiensis TaxID=546364 RepID=A0A1K1QED4_9PSEU|nr:DNA polymerase III subunit gamma and tau [Amycolatopsis australiensis]SFW57987.1 DNA polymerase-3 subunit gamma/tau [Amycolatopsis australiensis]